MEYLNTIIEGFKEVYGKVTNYFDKFNPQIVYAGILNNSLEEISLYNFNHSFWNTCFSKRGKGGKEKKKGKISTHTGRKSSSKVIISGDGTKRIRKKRRGSRK